MRIRAFRAPDWLMLWLRDTLREFAPFVPSQSKMLRYALVMGLRELNRRLRTRDSADLIRDLERMEAEAKARPTQRKTRDSRLLALPASRAARAGSFRQSQSIACGTSFA
jgi:hypothetical protein